MDRPVGGEEDHRHRRGGEQDGHEHEEGSSSEELAPPIQEVHAQDDGEWQVGHVGERGAARDVQAVGGEEEKGDAADALQRSP